MELMQFFLNKEINVLLKEKINKKQQACKKNNFGKILF